MSQGMNRENKSLRCQRHRKRSQRRKIFCPDHGCYLHSVSPKRRLFADRPEQLRQKGISRKHAMMLVARQTAVLLEDEWLEAFWCDQCQDTKWYHVCREDQRVYRVKLASLALWQRVQGVVHPAGNPSVSEFTRRNARMLGDYGLRQFNFVR